MTTNEMHTLWFAETEFAATVELVVEVIFLYDLKAALLKAAFFPVIWPVNRGPDFSIACFVHGKGAFSKNRGGFVRGVHGKKVFSRDRGGFVRGIYKKGVLGGERGGFAESVHRNRVLGRGRGICGKGVSGGEMAVGDLTACPLAGFVDLVEGLPAGGCEGAGDYPETMGYGIFCRSQQSELEAFEAAPSPFRFGFQTLDSLQPVFMVVVSIDYFKTEGLCIPRALVLADFIFLAGIYVRIAIIYYRSDSVFHQVLDDCT